VIKETSLPDVMESGDSSDAPDIRRAVLVVREERESDLGEEISEFRGLAVAAGYRVAGVIRQRRGRDSRFQVGRGKIEEALAYRADRIIFYNPLSPGQHYNIRQEFGFSAMDRFNLILEIFASRASSREAKLQVELARLSYEAPFVKRMVSQRKLSERAGFMGSGAYEESIYQDMRSRMAKIRETLKGVERSGAVRRNRRREQGFDLVALAGYTNAGKSTLLNALTGSDVLEKDQLFTTLSPTTRAISSDQDAAGRRVLLTDTVGFIDDLPHFFIKAFHSTLSEISCADLILLVADLSDPPNTLRRKMVTCHKVLWDCGATAPLITALNKVDLVPEGELECRMEAISDLVHQPILVSARDSIGLSDLAGRIKAALLPWREVEITLPNTPLGCGELSRLYRWAEPLCVEFGQDIRVRLRARDQVLDRLGLMAADPRGDRDRRCIDQD